MNNSIQTLKRMYTHHFPVQPCPPEDLKNIEDTLEIKLPKDVKDICSFYAGGPLGSQSLFSFYLDGDDFNVCEKTLFYRYQVNLPHKYLGLGESNSVLTLLDTEEQEVFRVETEELYNGYEETEMEEGFSKYPSFSSFFSHLLCREIQAKASSPVMPASSSVSLSACPKQSTKPKKSRKSKGLLTYPPSYAPAPLFCINFR